MCSDIPFSNKESPLFHDTLDGLLNRHCMALLCSTSVLAKMRVTRIVDMEEITSLLDVVGTAEENVHLFERDSSGLRDKEEDEERETDVDASEEVEGITRWGY
jgi:hypothetical protein